MRVPTKKLEAHADKQRFKPSTRRFFPSIYRKAKDYYQSFVIDLKEINDEIAKTKGKGFSDGTLNYVREQITNSPAIKVIRKYSAYIFEVKIIPFSDLEKNESGRCCC
jgi:hypothetical protein